MKAYTDLEQSKKLAKILPTESADMYYVLIDTDEDKYDAGLGKYIGILPYYPCWSLAALLEQLPHELCDDDGNSVYLQIDKENDVYQLVYTDTYGDFEGIETGRYDDFVDACYEMIIKLKEQNLL